MSRVRQGWRVLSVAAVVAAMTALIGVPMSQAGTHSRVTKKVASQEATSAAQSSESGSEEGTEEGEHIMARAEQEAISRTAPGTSVSAAAFAAAQRQARALPTVGGVWRELTHQPYQNDSPVYRDPVFSNSGAGWGLTSGRMTSLTVSNKILYAGAADGGVWRSVDRGAHWSDWSTGLPTLSIGSLATAPDGSIWAGTGEANTSSDEFKGQGVFMRSAAGSSWTRVGDTELRSTTIYRVYFADHDHVFAATSRGLYRHSASSASGAWRLVLKPDPNPHNSPYRTSHITDVTNTPGSHGRTVLAALGWRGGTLPSDTAYNGFYVSHHFGAAGTFHRITPHGAIDASDIGRTTFATAPTTHSLYAVIESPKMLAAPEEDSGFSNLQGVFVSRTGSPAGPWHKLADAKELSESGSSLNLETFGAYPGIQTWYDEYITVDRVHPNRVYLGLEEVFQSNDRGRSWRAVGPYWNFNQPCYHGGLHDCRNTTHPDQHALLVNRGRVYVGNDGGVYQRRAIDYREGGWGDPNASLHTLQYYFAGSGAVAGGLGYWGGMQDNGVSLLKPPYQTMYSPFGGDGGDVIVDPNNANRAVVEYVNLDMALTTDGGKNFREISPSCAAFTYTPKPCDPTTRFIAPFETDVNNPNHHWVAGGQYVWNSTAGWNTRCSADSCDWKRIHDTGAAHSITAIADKGRTIYAAWCYPGPSCNPGLGTPFDSGIDTNYGGSWHRLDTSGLPNRYINAITVDPNDPAHVYVGYGAFSRRWIPGAAEGHVFETSNGGASWTDVSGNLPDVPVDDILLSGNNIIAASDVGNFVSRRATPDQWSRLGTGLPNVVTWDLSPEPGRSGIVAATHGRGLWELSLP